MCVCHHCTCVIQRLTEVIHTTSLSVIRPLSRSPYATLINTDCQREAPLIRQQHAQMLYQCSHTTAAGLEDVCCFRRDAAIAINHTRHSYLSCGCKTMRINSNKQFRRRAKASVYVFQHANYMFKVLNLNVCQCQVLIIMSHMWTF